MTSRTRNLAILGIVAGAARAGALVIVPGIAAVEGHQARPRPRGRHRARLPGPADAAGAEVTPQAVDDAIETIRKRTDALGVSEPEIQRAGARPDLGRPARRAERRARDRAGRHHRAAPVLRLGAERARTRPATRPTRARKALFQAVEAASKQKGKAEATDVAAGLRHDARARPTRANDTASGPLLPVRPRPAPDRARQAAAAHRRLRAVGGTCKELLVRLRRRARASRPSTPRARSAWSELEALGSGGPPAGSRVIEVPEGIVVVEGEPAREPAAADQALLRARGRLGADRRRTSRTPRPAPTRTPTRRW